MNHKREISVNNHRMPLQSWSHKRLTFILLSLPSFPHFMSFGTSIIETPKQLHPNRNTHGCLFCYSPLSFVSKHTHRRSSLRMKDINGCVQRTGTLPFDCDGDAVGRDVIVSGDCRHSGFVMEDHRREDQTCTDPHTHNQWLAIALKANQNHSILHLLQQTGGSTLPCTCIMQNC